MKKTIFVLSVLCSITAAQYARAQSIGPSTLNAAGGTATIGGDIYDWSVGEMTMVSTFTTASITVTQGVLQPYDTSLAVQQVALNKDLQVYPNPASSELNIAYTAATEGKITYRLMDVTGKLIMNQTTPVQPGLNREKLDMANLPCATYMLEVICTDLRDNSSATSYKIEKTK